MFSLSRTLPQSFKFSRGIISRSFLVSKTLDSKVNDLANKYLPLAKEILKEAIRIPADYTKTDPKCGTSNHEGPRLEYLKNQIIKHKAVSKPGDVWTDDFGNLCWKVTNPNDGISPDFKKVIYFDGHTDTVNPLREEWTKKLGTGVDCFNGLTNKNDVSIEALISELGSVPPKSDWEKHILFGRGSTDQLGGVISQIIATKIMLELKDEGLLDGVSIKSIGTIQEEDNDGAGPLFAIRNDCKNAKPREIPDVIIFTEGTGDIHKGRLGIYRGQRGRMQIEVEVTGRSSHGSMPWAGLNPVEHGSLIIKEAAERYEKLEGFKTDEFLGAGSRTCSWGKIDTPSDCAVPEKFTFRFDRRITVGEDPLDCVADIENMASVEKCRKAGLNVKVRIPKYTEKTWKGYQCNNDQTYMSWVTPTEHIALKSAVDTYKKVVTPFIEKKTNQTVGESIPEEPRVDRWIFSTDGVGVPVPENYLGFDVPERKNWIHNGGFKWPAMFGFGAGCEQFAHKIGEYVDLRELKFAISMLARFPSRFAEIDKDQK
ncbi:peptidase m20 domain-containing protein [Anaeramoeba flamelloides]|uniref:Peptidase m20 domain-containing protein n=1 Tax=Anaeramoeba flamelloides TaxID=1746091 RepID=A0AAV7Y421_9EUKA|nr:peptidase m20 domain-containing protein [Anaeramoeba flamelloides]